MKKNTRQEQILDLLNRNGQVSVSEIMQALSVSDMTVRRDLNDLSNQGLLIRTHGGAQRIITSDNPYERSHLEKKRLNEIEKTQIAQYAAQYVEEGDTIFIGPGTTLEYFSTYLFNKSIRVITNSLPVFENLNPSASVDLLLTGGEFRNITGAFVGSMSNRAIENMRFAKAFISSNGIVQNAVFTYSEEEGEIQKNALNNAFEKFLLIDSSKINHYDFYEFYQLKDFTHVITDEEISDDSLHILKDVTDILVAN